MICNLCPRECGIDRTEYNGYCGSGDVLSVAEAELHHWEEPCVSGTRGSGAVFFTGCALRCDFCQNSVISRGDRGKSVTAERFYDILFELKGKGAHNVNLVTADHYLPFIIPILKTAKADGLSIPVLLNTSSYIKEQTVSALAGAVDGYIADFKFSNSALSQKYCNAPDYPDIAKAALERMVTQTGAPILDSDGILQSGVIVRVLVMPTHLIDAKQSIKYLHDRFGDSVLLSVMSQYTPMDSCPHPSLARALSETEYRSVLRYVERLDVKGYIQQYGANGERYIPNFNCEGV